MRTTIEKTVRVVRSAERFHTKTDWLDSRHSFSFGGHFDPENTHHGLLLVNNDDIVRPSSGFAPHRHEDMEIVTWILSGRLSHKDSGGHSGTITPGLAQRMSAGRGVLHSEMNPSRDEDVHLVQMWVPPDTRGLPPSYEQKDLSGSLESGELVPLASGRGHEGAVRIHQRAAVLWGARLRPGHIVRLPDAPFVHLYVAKGKAALNGAGSLLAGDAVRLAAAGAPELTADSAEGAEALVWEMHDTL